MENTREQSGSALAEDAGVDDEDAVASELTGARRTALKKLLLT